MKHRFWLLLAVMASLIAVPGGNTQAQPHDPAPDLAAHLAQQRTNTKDGPFAKVGGDLAQLYSEYEAHLARVASGAAAPDAFVPGDPLIRRIGDTVIIDAVASHDVDALRADLESLGLQGARVWGRRIAGQFPITAIDELAALDSLQFARPAYAWRNVGRVTSQGVRAMRADQLPPGIDGSGVAVGVLSDSFDCQYTQTTAEQDVASGDLPPGIVALKDYNQNDCIDEGRAMMQLVADVAPVAKQLFRTAFLGELDFAQGIRDLAAAGADVIVDDVIYFAEPMFQDGAIAQAVDAVVAQGIPYFSSAGNAGRLAYEGAFAPAPNITLTDSAQTYTPHDFDPGSAVDPYQRITIASGARINIVLQWDAPFASISKDGLGSPNDLDLFLFNSNGKVIAQSVDNNIDHDPVEILSFENRSSADVSADLLIGKFIPGSGPPPPNPAFIKYVIFTHSSVTIDEYSTNSGTLYGHPNAAGAVAVGAAFYGDTPAFGTDQAQLEPFSSAGTTPIFFDADGTRRVAPETRQKPEVVGPDGTNTTFFIPGNDIEGDAFENFFGTSAAAPHVAGVAALLLEANPALAPATVYRTLEATADDMLTPGFDTDSGSGLVRADDAVKAVSNADIAVDTAVVSDVMLLGNPITYTITVSNTGIRAAEQVVLTDTLPEKTIFVTATASADATCAHAKQHVTCNLGTISGGAHASATIVITSPVTGTLTSNANATTSTPELSTANNSDTATTVVVLPQDAADVSLSITDTPDPVAAGSTLTYTLEVANHGLAAASSVTLTDTLPAGAALVRAAGTGWECRHQDALAVCTRASLARGATAPLTVTVAAPAAPGTISTTATVSAATPDAFKQNNTAIQTTAVVSAARRLFLPILARPGA